MTKHKVRPVIGKIFAFEDLKAALDETARPSGIGKTVIRFDAHGS